jgi:hypothetical protein
MASVSRALSRIKQDLGPFLSADDIRNACRSTGHRWRERILGPIATLHLFVLQLLHRNTAIRALRHLADAMPNASAYCRARMRFPLAALRTLLRCAADAINKANGVSDTSRLWHGHRTLLLDGSSTIAPDTPATQKVFPQPSNQKRGCGFPVPKILGMIDAFTGVLLEIAAFPLCTHEAAKTWTLHPRMNKGDLVVADRGFCSYLNLALLQAAGVLALLRVHQRQIVDFRVHRKHNPGRKNTKKGKPTSRWLRRLGKHDQLVEWVKPKQRPPWMSKAQFATIPQTLLMREIRYAIPRRGQRTLCVTIATTLLDEKLYSKQAIAELYGLRWSVETHLAELKTTLGMRKVKCQTPEGVEKELIVYALVYNLVRATMLVAARQQQVQANRISFIDALRWLQTATPDEEVPDLVVNPLRPGRHEPRVIKDLQDTYRKMTRPRTELRKAMKRGTFVTR